MVQCLTTMLQATRSSLVIGCSYDIYFAIAAVFLLTTAIPTAINYLSLMQHITFIHLARASSGRHYSIVAGSTTLFHCYWCTSMSFTTNISLLALLHLSPKLMLHQVRTLGHIHQLRALGPGRTSIHWRHFLYPTSQDSGILQDS